MDVIYVEILEKEFRKDKTVKRVRFVIDFNDKTISCLENNITMSFDDLKKKQKQSGLILPELIFNNGLTLREFCLRLLLNFDIDASVYSNFAVRIKEFDKSDINKKEKIASYIPRSSDFVQPYVNQEYYTYDDINELREKINDEIVYVSPFKRLKKKLTRKRKR